MQLVTITDRGVHLEYNITYNDRPWTRNCFFSSVKLIEYKFFPQILKANGKENWQKIMKMKTRNKELFIALKITNSNQNLSFLRCLLFLAKQIENRTVLMFHGHLKAFFFKFLRFINARLLHFLRFWSNYICYLILDDTKVVTLKTQAAL